MEEQKEYERKYRENERKQRQESFLAHAVPDISMMAPSPLDVAEIKHQKNLEMRREAWRRRREKKKLWEEKCNSSAHAFAMADDVVLPSVKSTTKFNDCRTSVCFEKVCERLNTFVKTHAVSVSSRQLGLSKHPFAGSLSARILGFSVNVDPRLSALSVWVQPPAQMAEDAHPVYIRFLRSSPNPSRMDLLTYMHIVSLMNPQARAVRFYDDVQCTIDWNPTCLLVQPWNFQESTPPRQFKLHPAILPLSAWIPTRVFFATDVSHLRQYRYYLDKLSIDPLMVPVFSSLEFFTLFTNPESALPSSPLASGPPGSSTSVVIEEIESHIVRPTPIYRKPVIFKRPLEEAKEVEEEQTVADERAPIDREPVQEPVRKRAKREGRERPPLLASTRVLRPRCLKRKFCE